MQAQYQEERRQTNENAGRSADESEPAQVRLQSEPVIHETKYTWVGASLQQKSLAVDYFNALERIKELEAETRTLSLELQLAKDLVSMS